MWSITNPTDIIENTPPVHDIRPRKWRFRISLFLGHFFLALHWSQLQAIYRLGDVLQGLSIYGKVVLGQVGAWAAVAAPAVPWHLSCLTWSSLGNEWLHKTDPPTHFLHQSAVVTSPPSACGQAKRKLSQNQTDISLHCQFAWSICNSQALRHLLAQAAGLLS